MKSAVKNNDRRERNYASGIKQAINDEEFALVLKRFTQIMSLAPYDFNRWSDGVLIPINQFCGSFGI